MKTEKRLVVFKSEVDAYLAEHGVRLATKRHRRRIADKLRAAKTNTVAA